jgi:homogentisate 1,2-dioxygenase
MAHENHNADTRNVHLSVLQVIAIEATSEPLDQVNWRYQWKAYEATLVQFYTVAQN